MTPEEYAAFFKFDLEAFDDTRDRSAQSRAGVIGVSDLHTCRERVRRTLVKAVPSDVPEMWAALVGTYVDQGVKQARQYSQRGLIHDVEVTVTLPNGIALLGHADEIDPDEPSVTDYKTKAGLAGIRRVGADEQQRAQRHLYYLGAHQAGLVPAQGIVRNIFIDRSGKDSHPHVEQEPFDMNVILTAQAWLEDAVYAAEHGEEAMKDWPRPMCESYCPFYTHCRLQDEKVEEEFLTGHRADLLAEFVTVKKQRTELNNSYDALRDDLTGVTGRSDKAWVRSTVTNGRIGGTRVDADWIEGAA